MSGSNIRVGLIIKDREFSADLVKCFKKYSSCIEVVMDKVPSGALETEAVVAKVRSSRISALFLSTAAENFGEIIKRIKGDVFLRTKIIAVVEDGAKNEPEEYGGLADFTVVGSMDKFLINTRLCAMCDEEFFELRKRDSDVLCVITEQILMDAGFDTVRVGYGYLAAAMMLIVFNREYMECLSALYYAVAHEAEAVSEKTVEKCMRTSIDKAWLQYEAAKSNGGEVNHLAERLFGEGKLSNGKALPILVGELERRFKNVLAGGKI